MKQFFYTAVLLLGCAFPVQAQKPLLWNYDRLYSVKTDETYARVKSGYEWNAKAFLDRENAVVNDKPAKFVADTRNYVSMGIYWWPDPENPGGPYIRKDGHWIYHGTPGGDAIPTVADRLGMRWLTFGNPGLGAMHHSAQRIRARVESAFRHSFGRR